MPREVPVTPSGCTSIICIDSAWVPIIAGKIAELESSDEWATTADWGAAYPQVVEIEACMASTCAEDLTGSMQEIGVLLALALGLPADSDGYLEVILPKLGPKINAAVDADTIGYLQGQNIGGKLARFASLQSLRELRGGYPNEWWDWLGITELEYASIFDIVSALKTKQPVEVTVDGEKKGIWEYLSGVLGAGADVSEIFDTVLNGYDSAVDTVDLFSDGALQTGTVITSMLTLVMLGEIKNALLGGAARTDTLLLSGNHNILDAVMMINKTLHPDRAYTEDYTTHTAEPPDTLMGAIRGPEALDMDGFDDMLYHLGQIDDYLS